MLDTDPVISRFPESAWDEIFRSYEGKMRNHTRRLNIFLSSNDHEESPYSVDDISIIGWNASTEELTFTTGLINDSYHEAVTVTKYDILEVSESMFVTDNAL